MKKLVLIITLTAIGLAARAITKYIDVEIEFID